MDPMTPLVAVVEDDQPVCRALCRLLRALHYEPAAFDSAEAFLDDLSVRRPCCAIVDLHLPGRKGIEILDHPDVREGRVPVIIMTGFDQAGMQERCLGAGAAAYLTKPIAAATLSAALRRITGAT
jgi:FixJ family two-component response regulator